MYGSRLLTKIVAKLESQRLTLPELFLIVVMLGLFRSVLETQIFSYPYAPFYHAHIISFYLAVFVGLILILRLFSGECSKKLGNVAICFYWLILLPPLLDLFSGRKLGYDYIERNEFLVAVSSFGLRNPDIMGIGQIIVFALALILIALYTFLKTASVFRALLTAGATYLFLMIIGTPTLNILIFPTSAVPHNIYFLYYLVLMLIFSLCIFHLDRKGLVVIMLQNIRYPQTTHFLLMTLAGVIVAHNFPILSIFDYPLNLQFGYVVLGCMAVFFAWQFAVLVNDIYDVKIDAVTNPKRPLVAHKVSIADFARYAVTCALLSIFIAVQLSFWICVLIVVYLLLAIFYSVPPIRLRNTVAGLAVIGLGSAIAFLIGALMPYSLSQATPLRPGDIVEPALSTMTEKVAFVVALGTALGSAMKDLRDYSGDQMAGVKNLFTIFGLENGTNIASIFLCISFILPALIFPNPVDIFVFSILGLIAGMLFKFWKETIPVYCMYFILLAYLFIRW